MRLLVLLLSLTFIATPVRADDYEDTVKAGLVACQLGRKKPPETGYADGFERCPEIEAAWADIVKKNEPKRLEYQKNKALEALKRIGQ